jgi:transcriptional regulator with XRE-family HTH domain
MVRGRKNPLYVGFARRLRSARKAAELNGAALSAAAGMSHNAVAQLETGARVPRLDTIAKLAKALAVSPCWLAFGVELPCEQAADLAARAIGERLLMIRRERSLSRRELGRLSGTSDNFVQTTEAATTVPSIAGVEQLAKTLNVSVCWLAFGIGRPELPAGRRVRSDTPPAPDPHA